MLGGSVADFESLQAVLADTTQVCAISRAGLGQSPPWPADQPDPSAGMAADQVRATLEANDISGPYVLLGLSYGGLVAQAFAARHREALAGLVLEDSATREWFDAPEWSELRWAEGGRDIDTELTYSELDGLALGEVPLVVLTQGTMAHVKYPEFLLQTHDDLAALSRNVMHIIATEAGHVIHVFSEPLVAKAVETVVAAVREGEPLPACDDKEWGTYTGACRRP
jgi:pimeloyl-ACP methyl ester carboxylesterase